MLVAYIIAIIIFVNFKGTAAIHGIDLDPFASPEDSNSAEASGEQLPGLCPDDWLEGVITYPSHKQKICIMIDKEPKTWENARDTCQDDYGFLVSLSEGPIMVNGVDIQEYLIQEGLRNVWTGIHGVDGQIQWDGIVPKAVPARDSSILGWEIDSAGDTWDINDLCGELNITTWHQQIVLPNVNSITTNTTSTTPTETTTPSDSTEVPPNTPDLDSNGPTQSSPTTSMETILDRLQKSIVSLQNSSQAINNLRKALSQAQEEMATQSDVLPDSQLSMPDLLANILDDMNVRTGPTSAQVADPAPSTQNGEGQQNGTPDLPSVPPNGVQPIQSQDQNGIVENMPTSESPPPTIPDLPLPDQQTHDNGSPRSDQPTNDNGQPPSLQQSNGNGISPPDLQPTLSTNMQLLLSELNQRLSSSNDSSSEIQNGTFAEDVAKILALLNKTTDLTSSPSSAARVKRRSMIPDFLTRVQSIKLHFNKIKLQSCDIFSPFVCIRRPITIRQNVSTCAPHWVGDIFHKKCYKKIPGPYTFTEATHKCKEYWSRVAGSRSSTFHNKVILEAADAQDILAPQMQSFWVREKGGANSQDTCKAVIGRDFKMKSCTSSLDVMCEKNRQNIYDNDNSGQDSSEVVKPSVDIKDASARPVLHRLSYRDDNMLNCDLESTVKELPYIWYKDGIPVSPAWDSKEFRLNQQLARKIERIIGESITQPELQGVYQCKVWSQTPDMELLKSRKSLVMYKDVVTLIGEIGINGISPIVELYFNQLHRSMVLITKIERGLVSLNNHLTMILSRTYPFILNIKSRVSKIISRPGKVIFKTYIKKKKVPTATLR